MKTIIYIIAILVLLGSLKACAMGGNSAKPRKTQDKMWHLCQDFEMVYHDNLSPIGKVCNNACLNYKKSTCKKWERNIMDLSKESDFNFFRNAAFILINESTLRGD